MSNVEAIRIRIRRLLALAGNNPNEHEAASALAKARELMIEYGIEEVGQDEERIQAIKGDWIKGVYKSPWVSVVAGAVCDLYSVRHIIVKKQGLHRFAGQKYQIEFAEETFLHIIDQIEELYKRHLKHYQGELSKRARGELRESFKYAAAHKVRIRVREILAKTQLSGKALVVINTAKQAADDLVSDLPDAKTRVVQGWGTGMGLQAGNQVQIQKGVKA